MLQWERSGYVGVDVTSNFVSLYCKTISALEQVITVHSRPASMFAYSNGIAIKL